MKFGNWLLDLIFPTKLKCIFCDEELDGTTSNCTCAECYRKLPFIRSYCKRCGVSVVKGDEICLNCKSTNYSFEFARAVFDYTGEVMNVVHKLKYNGLKFLSEPIAGFMCDCFASSNMEADIICAVPLHPNRLKERGFNQSELLARVLANKFKIPYLKLCNKVKENPSQTNLDFKHRRNNVKDVYALNPAHRKDIKGNNILLIDDVFTTGATSNEIAKVLKSAGANKVFVLTFAHTPTPKDSNDDAQNEIQ